MGHCLDRASSAERNFHRLIVAATSALPTAARKAPEFDSKSGLQIWRVGTLRYTKAALCVLFFWLLWNDVCLMLMENVAPQLTPLLLKGNGASNKEIAFFMTTFAGGLTLWINPFVSTWSDRCRSQLGRRRPFLLFAAPPCALMLAAIPFGGEIASWARFSGAGAAVLVIGILFALYSVFNAVILAIFTYYFWDVVPEELLGRFTALTRIVATLANFLWSYFLLGLATQYMRLIFVGLAAIFAVLYLLTVWQVKEGDYPPPDPHKRGGFLASIRAYFIECFSESYFLWIYAASAIYQLNNVTNVFQIFYLKNDLGLSLDTIGKMRAWPLLVVMVFGYPIGVLVDKCNALRVVAPSLALVGLVNVLGFFFLRGPWSLFIITTLLQITLFCFSVSANALTVEIFPREKLGQFCSANATSCGVATMAAAVPVGMLFDWLNNYRYIFLWSAAFQMLAALTYLKVYFNWKKRKGLAPVPHAS
jgi:maltose/moltooligosaccharide transporter